MPSITQGSRSGRSLSNSAAPGPGGPPTPIASPSRRARTGCHPAGSGPGTRSTCMRASAGCSSRACISAEPMRLPGRRYVDDRARRGAPRAPSASISSWRSAARSSDSRVEIQMPLGRVVPGGAAAHRAPRRPAARPRRSGPASSRARSAASPAHHAYQGARSSARQRLERRDPRVARLHLADAEVAKRQTDVRAQQALAILAASASRSTSRFSARVSAGSTMSISAAKAV